MVVPMENSFFEGGDDLDQDDLLKTLQGSSTFVLNVPFRSDGSTNDHLRLAKDFLVASFVGERLAPHCKAIRFMSIKSGSPQRAMISFSFVPEAHGALAAELHMLLAGLSDRSDGEAEVFREERDRYEQALLYDEMEVRFPTLVDDFFAHFVLAALDGWDEPSIERLRGKHPGILYGFWRSPRSGEVGYEVHVSSYCWIVPQGVDVRKVLRAYSQLGEDLQFEEALPISINNKEYLIRGNEAVQINSNIISAARWGAMEINERRKESNEGHLVELMGLLYGERPLTYLIDRHRPMPVCQDRRNQFIFLQPSILESQKVIEIEEEMRTLLDRRDTIINLIP
jgi:hypothetical protein